MFVTMYNFSKRENSTKRPKESDKTISGDVCFKQTTSLLTPTLIWAVGHEDNVEDGDNRTDDEKAMSTNYCLLGGKYYYVTDVRRSNRNHIEFDCRIDLLATYKSEILSTTAYVLYSDSHGKVDIVDERVDSTCEIISDWEEKDLTLFRRDYVDGVGNAYRGTYIMQVLNEVPTTYAGFNKLYVISPSGIPIIANKCIVDEALESLNPFYADPSEAISNLRYYPMAMSDIPTKGCESLKIGPVEFKDDFLAPYEVSSSYVTRTYAIDIPWVCEKDFRRSSHFTTCRLYLPFVGIVSVPVEYLYNADILMVKTSIDFLSGTIGYHLYVTADDEINISIAYYTSTCAVEVPVGSSKLDLSNLISGVGTTIAGGALALSGVGTKYGGAMMASGIGSIFNGVANATSNTAYTSNIGGKMGTRITEAFGYKFFLEISTKVLSEDIENKRTSIGLPYCETVQLSNLSGYCQTVNVSVNCSATMEHKQEINNYLNGGVYLE